MSKALVALLVHYSTLYGVSPTLVKAIIEVESRGSPSLVGEAGEVGLMQLLPSSFPNVEKLDESRTNLRLGIRYLAKMKRQCPHQDGETWIVCYNAGIKGGSKIRFPKKFPYYINVMREYERLKKANVENLSVQAGLGKRKGSCGSIGSEANHPWRQVAAQAQFCYP